MRVGCFSPLPLSTLFKPSPCSSSTESISGTLRKLPTFSWTQTHRGNSLPNPVACGENQLSSERTEAAATRKSVMQSWKPVTPETPLKHTWNPMWFSMKNRPRNFVAGTPRDPYDHHLRTHCGNPETPEDSLQGSSKHAAWTVKSKKWHRRQKSFFVSCTLLFSIKCKCDFSTIHYCQHGRQHPTWTFPCAQPLFLFCHSGIVNQYSTSSTAETVAGLNNAFLFINHHSKRTSYTSSQLANTTCIRQVTAPHQTPMRKI